MIYYKTFIATGGSIGVYHQALLYGLKYGRLTLSFLECGFPGLSFQYGVGSMAGRDLEEILADLNSRTQYGSPKFYQPLRDEEERKLVHDWYRSQLTLPLEGARLTLKNKVGTIIAFGYERIVVGDYGAYIEFSQEDAALDNIELRWPGKPKRPVKYLWMQTKDELKTKVYHQCAKVSYADYLPGFYYVAPEEIIDDQS